MPMTVVSVGYGTISGVMSVGGGRTSNGSTNFMIMWVNDSSSIATGIVSMLMTLLINFLAIMRMLGDGDT
jgi:hypothetical protein